MYFHSDWGAFDSGFLMDWAASDQSNIGPNPTNVPTLQPGMINYNKSNIFILFEFNKIKSIYFTEHYPIFIFHTIIYMNTSSVYLL